MPTVVTFRGLKVKNVRSISVGSLLLLLASVSTTDAASMEYCRPYAAQTSQLLLTYAWQRAYTYCLNQDEPPLIPETAQGAIQIIVPAPLDVLPMSRPVRVGDVPATGPPSAPMADPPSPVAPHSKEWNTYCKKHWPASFRVKDGTVIRYGSKNRKRTPCPGPA
jgi:hypothetical protein